VRRAGRPLRRRAFAAIRHRGRAGVRRLLSAASERDARPHIVGRRHASVRTACHSDRACAGPAASKGTACAHRGTVARGARTNWRSCVRTRATRRSARELGLLSREPALCASFCFPRQAELLAAVFQDRPAASVDGGAGGVRRAGESTDSYGPTEARRHNSTQTGPTPYTLPGSSA
jgi:hypothetical protein